MDMAKCVKCGFNSVYHLTFIGANSGNKFIICEKCYDKMAQSSKEKLAEQTE
jgi:hypothetical protein